MVNYVKSNQKQGDPVQSKSVPFIWHDEVRAYELDLQGIVNNAVYLNYFDHVRVTHCMSLGIDWSEWHHKGFDFVLFNADITFKSALRAHDTFYITSTIERISRLKILFTQTIFRKPNDELVAIAKNTVVCLDNKKNRPVFPAEIAALF